MEVGTRTLWLSVSIKSRNRHRGVRARAGHQRRFCRFRSPGISRFAPPPLKPGRPLDFGLSAKKAPSFTRGRLFCVGLGTDRWAVPRFARRAQRSPPTLKPATDLFKMTAPFRRAGEGRQRMSAAVRLSCLRARSLAIFPYSYRFAAKSLRARRGGHRAEATSSACPPSKNSGN